MSETESELAETDVRLRAIPAVVGVLALMTIPAAMLYALGSVMIFDAPTSDRNPLNWMLFFLYLAKPLMLVATVVLAVRAFLSLSYRRLIILITVPAIWWACYWTLQTVSVFVCEGQTVCA